ncbi:MAG TPA: acyl-CoA dehydrogenase family protein [Myxococcales bacterium]|nr:acyl-CoA dehydrogenase family protein [Myxococcales bacterium]
MFDPDEHQRLVQSTARKYAQESLAKVAAQLDREGRFPAEQLAQLAELGMMGINIPEEYGGAQAGVVAYALAMMEIAQGCASTAVTMAVTNMVGEAIVKFGTPEQRRRYVPELTSGRFAAGAFGLSEPSGGSDAAGMRSSARKNGAGWVLNGEKQWITSGDRAGVIIVWARTQPGPGARGISAFLVEGGQPGLRIGKHEDKMGLRASSTVSLAFEDLRLRPDQLIGEEGHGFNIAMAALDGGRIGIAAQAVGIATAALSASVRYAKDRRAFGQPIGDFQAIRFLLADCDTQIEAARLLTLRAAGLKERGLSCSREASMAKLFATEAANRVCDAAVQVHGGYGYIDEFPVERHYRDVRASTLYEGTSEVQRLVISRDVLKDR